MKVKNKMYESDEVFSESGGVRPELLSPNLFERLRHLVGSHWSYGQPYCVVCGKEDNSV